MAAAFAAHGVPDAYNWAAEVDEYRPYENDGWAKLKDQCCLGKYNPSPQVLNGIIASLYV
jgi:hypothetical protein